jgi:hypothetical protein
VRQNMVREREREGWRKNTRVNGSGYNTDQCDSREKLQVRYVQQEGESLRMQDVVKRMYSVGLGYKKSWAWGFDWIALTVLRA